MNNLLYSYCLTINSLINNFYIYEIINIKLAIFFKEMGSRLYDEFMKKLKVPLVQRREPKQKDGKPVGGAKDEIVICIPLKGGQGVRLLNFSYNYSNLWNQMIIS